MRFGRIDRGMDRQIYRQMDRGWMDGWMWYAGRQIAHGCTKDWTDSGGWMYNWTQDGQMNSETNHSSQRKEGMDGCAGKLIVKKGSTDGWMNVCVCVICRRLNRLGWSDGQTDGRMTAGLRWTGEWIDTQIIKPGRGGQINKKLNLRETVSQII